MLGQFQRRLLSLRDRLLANYWFIPVMMALLAVVLSVFTLDLDVTLGAQFVQATAWLYRNTPEGAREVLSTVASSMITVTGLVFSLTMVVLAQAAQQYGSLVLGNFMRDRGNQVVLGTFTASFIYSLLVLRTINSTENNVFVPNLSGLIGVVLAIISLAVLIYFIHHISESIQATTIITRIGKTLLGAIDDLYPEALGVDELESGSERASQLTVLEHFDKQSAVIHANASGYLQMIDEQKLMDAAREHDVILKLRPRPGDFMVEGSLLGGIYPAVRVSDPLASAISGALILGSTRTQTQDMALLFNQLVTIAVRALSPAINDPYTAVMCIDRLGEALCRLGGRELPSPYRYDEAGNLRIITRALSFEDMIKAAFDEIRRYGCSDLLVSRHLLQTLRMVGECAKPDYGTMLRAYATLVWEQSRRQFEEERDRIDLDDEYHAAAQALAPI